MGSSIRLGKVFGISVELHYSWFIIFGLLVWSLSSGYFPTENPDWSVQMNWIVGGITTVVFFLSVLIHEFAHSLVAKMKGMPVNSIILFIFGGVSNLKQEPKTAADEFVIAVVGPLSSLVLALVFLIVGIAVRGISLPFGATASYLAFINLTLAVFNLIPGFPLDGGRVLRSAIWWRNNNFLAATRTATRVGRGMGYAVIFAGLFLALGGDWMPGLWFLFIGWFLSNAAESTYQQTVLDDVLKGVPVAQLMSREFASVGPGLTLSELVRDYVLLHNWRAYPVAWNGSLVGLVSLSDLKKFPREEWDTVTVRQAMTAEMDIKSLKPTDDAMAALQLLGSSNVNQLPVIEAGAVIGFVNRASLLNYIHTRQELGVKPIGRASSLNGQANPERQAG